MPIDEAALMAAVDSGIADATPAPAPTPTPAPAADTTDEGTPNAVATDDAPGETPPADGEGSPAGAEGVPADGGSDAADTDKPADGDEVPADGSEPGVDKKAAEAAGKPAEEARKPDPLNDPLPNALKKETKERIQTLVSMVKENTTKLEAVQRDRDDILNAIVETKATPAQYGQALEYLRMVNSQSREDRARALDFMQREIAALARMLGKPVPGVNMLEGHQDLIDEVATGRLSPERAQEIAGARNAHQFQTLESRANQEHEQTVRAQQQARAQGVQALNQLGAQLKAADPVAYEAKRAILVNSLKPVFAKIPPNEWAATFKRAYDALPAPAAPRVIPPTPASIKGSPAGGGGNTPLRASNPAGGAAPAPKSLAEAIDLGIQQAG